MNFLRWLSWWQVMYTGSQAEVHQEQAQSLRARWTYAPVACPMTATMEGEIEDDGEDIGHLSLRTGDCRTPAVSSAPCSGDPPPSTKRCQLQGKCKCTIVFCWWGVALLGALRVCMYDSVTGQMQVHHCFAVGGCDVGAWHVRTYDTGKRYQLML